MATVLPLRVWLCSAALASGMIAVFALMSWSSLHKPDNSIALKTQQYFDTTADTGNLHVIALGSSLLWAASPPARQAIPGIDWGRMIKPGMGIGRLEPSLEVIERHLPDVLVIEENLLLPDARSFTADDVRQYLANTITGLAYRSTGYAWLAPPPAHLPLADQRLAFDCRSPLPAVRQQYILDHAAELQTYFESHFIDLKLSSRLEQLSRRGVHIVLLDIGRSNQTEHMIANEKQRWQKQLRQILPPGPRISYLSSTNLLQQDMYCDGSHMNAAGARVFGAWWNAQLQQLRKER